VVSVFFYTAFCLYVCIFFLCATILVNKDVYKTTNEHILLVYIEHLMIDHDRYPGIRNNQITRYFAVISHILFMIMSVNFNSYII